MYLDGKVVAHTLELAVKDGLPGSAIPLGRYTVTLWNSPHFGRMMPLLQGVPGRSSIEIHWGNDVEDTRGCILVGDACDVEHMEIFHTRKKFDELFPAIKEAVENEGCWIVIEDAQFLASNHVAVQEAVT